MHNLLIDKLKEALASVLPLSLIILLLCFTLTPLPSGVFLSFLLGTVLLVLGIGLFSLGADLSMTRIGEYIGSRMAKSRRVWVIVLLSFLVGALITISEPDLQVLAEQVPSIDKWTMILSVAAGVGAFLVIAMLRELFRIRLRYLLLGFYAIVFILAAFVDPGFWAIAFDSGGVTTGPMTVPFIMTLGVGVTAIRSDREEKNDSFGFVALCSVGPILSVLVLGLIFSANGGEVSPAEIADVATSRDLAATFFTAIPTYLREVLIALAPIAVLFFVFQALVDPMPRRQLARIGVGLAYTYVGLVLFLMGANVGFMPAGRLIGEAMGSHTYRWLVIPIGMVIGYFLVSAEPAIQVLEKQVEEVTAGAIPRRALSVSLSIGVAISVGIAMVRSLTGISVMYFLAGGYAIAMILTFFTDDIFSSIAFDSGGVASGPMTATFLLAMALGVCSAVGGNPVTDAFGMVAMVAMTPLITIQILGVVWKIKRQAAERRQAGLPELVPDEEVIDF